MTQASLLCGCGATLPCERCARRERLNREQFDGNREAVLRRDEYQCQACGELDGRLILVHHRTRRLYVTLCRRCHPVIHFTARPSYAMLAETPFLYLLWRELHRGQPEQLPLEAPAPQQLWIAGDS